MINDQFKHLFQETVRVSKGLSSTAAKATQAIVAKERMISPEQNAKHRLSICNACEFLIKKTGRCGQCGCFVSLKVKLNFEECPIGKW
jgi:uncharacterized paraquat-inducible protein A